MNETTTVTELSPAAQAMLDAYENARDGEYVEGVWVVNERTMIAAALRAAADQVVPECEPPRFVGEADHADWFARDDVRDDLLRIANELEAV